MVMLPQFCKHIKNHQIVHFKRATVTACKLYAVKLLLKRDRDERQREKWEEKGERERRGKRPMNGTLYLGP